MLVASSQFYPSTFRIIRDLSDQWPSKPPFGDITKQSRNQNKKWLSGSKRRFLSVGEIVNIKYNPI